MMGSSETEWEHPGYGAGAGSTHRTVEDCPCGDGRVVHEKDDIPGFRSNDTYFECSTCQAVRSVIRWETSGEEAFSALASYPGAEEIERWIKENPDVLAHVRDHFDLLPEDVVGAALILAKIDAPAELEFFTAVSAGNQPKNSPIAAMVRFLESKRRPKRIEQQSWFHMIFGTWNEWRRGEIRGRMVYSYSYTGRPTTPIETPI